MQNTQNDEKLTFIGNNGVYYLAHGDDYNWMKKLKNDKYAILFNAIQKLGRLEHEKNDIIEVTTSITPEFNIGEIIWYVDVKNHRIHKGWIDMIKIKNVSGIEPSPKSCIRYDVGYFIDGIMDSFRACDTKSDAIFKTYEEAKKYFIDNLEDIIKVNRRDISNEKI